MNVRTTVHLVVASAWLVASTAGVSLAADKHDAAKHGEQAAALKQDLRKLWTDHVVWTRDYIIAAVGDQPDAMAAANRLMRNQEDIGNDVGKYDGAAAGQQLTSLLKQHISIAVDLIKAAKAGDKAGQQQADAKWQQ